ncbi:DUF2500 domain-containing protein [bacterium]|nr:MAG: DUF2500 domain-containing protein [bacterium]
MPEPGPMFTITPIFIGVVFVIVIGSIIVAAVKGISEWSYNNDQPVLTTGARVVSKRTDVRSRGSMHGSDDSFHRRHRTFTDYYVTFEFGSGERREVEVDGQEYGMLVEGDHGDFTYQGTRYKGFVRRV